MGAGRNRGDHSQRFPHAVFIQKQIPFGGESRFQFFQHVPFELGVAKIVGGEIARRIG